MCNNWWQSYIQSARTKSLVVFEGIKKDLDELKATVRSEISLASSFLSQSLKFNETPIISLEKSSSSIHEDTGDSRDDLIISSIDEATISEKWQNDWNNLWISTNVENLLEYINNRLKISTLNYISSSSFVWKHEDKNLIATKNMEQEYIQKKAMRHLFKFKFKAL